jgi:choline dehydrogenase-like flavoprotein
VGPRASFDVVVVGGGAAGCVVAARLAEAGDRTVALVEAGPDVRPIPTDWRNGWSLPTTPDWELRSEPDAAGDGRRLRRGRLLGGTSWLTRFAVRGSALDFDGWAARGNVGVTFADLLPAFRRLEADAEFGQVPWHGDDGPLPITRYPHHDLSDIHAAAVDALIATGIPPVADHNAPDAIGVGRMPMNSHAGARVTTADAYLSADRRPANLTILGDSMVATVTIDPRGATGIRLTDGSTIAAGEVVLSAGVYGSPTILLRSGLGPAEHLQDLGISVRVDLAGVGANLADHPAVSVDTGWRGAGSAGPILHSIATFRSRGSSADAAQDLMLWLSDPTEDDPEFWIEAVLLKPIARGSVRLRSSDASIPPRITLPVLREAPDVDRMAEAVRLAHAVASSPHVGRQAAATPAPSAMTGRALRRLVAREAYSLPHVVGTCAMGPRPDDGAVVDQDGRVHGIDRLRVVDASIIPEAPSGFPHLVTIMLAEHLSGRMLDDRHGHDLPPVRDERVG